ncbi:MAG: HEPN domain-containing protein [Caulobacteraceae bacterium]
MTPTARAYLDKARDDLDEADKIAAIGLAKAAARSAYYAAFHAAEAFIVERTGKVAKTHAGVRSEFARLALDALGGDRTFTSFLVEAYKYKELGDYGVGPDATVTLVEARRMIVDARRFLEGVSALLECGGDNL